MITPLSGHDSLDFAGLERLVEHVTADGQAQVSSQIEQPS